MPSRKQKIKKICEGCEEHFTVHLYRSKTARFCSRSCKSLVLYKSNQGLQKRIGKKTFLCQECGTGFVDYRCKKRKFCSNRCSTKKIRDTAKLSQSIKEAWSSGRRRGGYKMSERGKKNISDAHKKKVKEGTHHLWRGGITPVNQKIRTSREYKLWREVVYKRDNYTCVWCHRRGGILNADHIKPFAQYPELRFAIDNGRTLCISCHKTTETYGRPKKKTK